MQKQQTLEQAKNEAATIERRQLKHVARKLAKDRPEFACAVSEFLERVTYHVRMQKLRAGGRGGKAPRKWNAPPLHGPSEGVQFLRRK